MQIKKFGIIVVPVTIEEISCLKTMLDFISHGFSKTSGNMLMKGMMMTPRGSFYLLPFKHISKKIGVKNMG